MKTSYHDIEPTLKNAFINKIKNYLVPKYLQKPLSIKPYDGTLDPDDHFQTVNPLLSFRGAQGPVKFKLFVLGLQKGDMLRFKNLKPYSINSWSEICKKFKIHFTTSKKQPKSIDNLGAIWQNPREPMMDYVEGLNM
jgi:hypothetical protein